MTVYVISKLSHSMKVVPPAKVGLFFLGRCINDYIVIVSNDTEDKILKFDTSNCNKIQAIVDNNIKPAP